MRYLKCNLPPERHEEILGKFWHYPTQEEEDAVHDLFTPHVFFETYGNEREVWATCCRQHGIIGKHGPKHGSEGNCPFCGQVAVWNAIGKYGEQMRSLREETHVAFLRRAGKALLIEAMQIEISYTKGLIYDGIYYDMNCWGQKAYYLAPGTVQMWERTRESNSIHRRNSTMRLDEINARLAAIQQEAETASGDALTALENEAAALTAERQQILNEMQARQRLRSNIAAGIVTGRTIEAPSAAEPTQARFTVDSAEYREAYLMHLQGRSLSAEQRAAVTATAAIPTQTLNRIVGVFDQNPILSRITMTYIPGNITIPVEGTVNSASWVAVGTASTDSGDSGRFVRS